jgi:addiction module RelE/StbE family toxin
MRVRFTKGAFADLEEIHSYIAADNPVAAAAVVRRVEQLLARLADFPAIGHPSERQGFRVLPLGRYPYLIFYEVTDTAVVIHHVRHGARRRPWD